MKDALDDLSPLARRGELTPPEEQRLDVLLQSSGEARLFHELGGRFDAEDPAAPVADAKSEAMVESLLKDLQQKSCRERRKLPRLTWLIAAAALLAASLAGAVMGVKRFHSAPAATPSVLERPSSSPGTRAPLGHALPQVTPPSVATREPIAPALSAESSSTPAAPLPSSAAELLSAAGRARRSGQSAEAVQLLQTLRSRYPHSPEASASDITLGKLQLERGGAAAALADFDGYLRRAPAGALAPEALWGRAQALSQLGRGAEAQQSLSELLRRYPNSPYTSAARAKLGSAAPRP